MTPLDWTGAGRSRFQNARQFRVFNLFTPALPRALHRYIDILYVFWYGRNTAGNHKYFVAAIHAVTPLSLLLVATFTRRYLTIFPILLSSITVKRKREKNSWKKRCPKPNFDIATLQKKIMDWNQHNSTQNKKTKSLWYISKCQWETSNWSKDCS